MVQTFSTVGGGGGREGGEGEGGGRERKKRERVSECERERERKRERERERSLYPQVCLSTAVRHPLSYNKYDEQTHHFLSKVVC